MERLHAAANVRELFDTPNEEVQKLRLMPLCCIGQDAEHIRGHLRAAEALSIEPFQFGHEIEEATAAKAEAISRMRVLLQQAERQERLDAKHRERLEEFRKAVSLSDEEITVENGAGIREAYEHMASGDVTEEMYGKYLPEAKRIKERAMVRYRKALDKLAWEVIDPDKIPTDTVQSSEILEIGMVALRALPITESIFGERVEEAKQKHALCVEGMERLLEKVKARELAQAAGASEEQVDRVGEQVFSGRKTQEERERAHRALEHGLTEPERAARKRRIAEASGELYEVVQRITEIVHVDEVNHTGVINAGEMLALLHRAEGLEARIEGRLN